MQRDRATPRYYSRGTARRCLTWCYSRGTARRCGINGEGQRRVKIVTTHCRLLCHYLFSGAEFFGDDLASYRNSSISCYSVPVEELRIVSTVWVFVRTDMSRITCPIFTRFCSCYPRPSPLAALRYDVLPVLRMTSCFLITGWMKQVTHLGVCANLFTTADARWQHG